MLQGEQALRHLAQTQVFGQAGLAGLAPRQLEHVEAVYRREAEAVPALAAPTLGLRLDAFHLLGLGSLGFYSFLADAEGFVEVVGRDVPGRFFAQLLLLLKSFNFLASKLWIQEHGLHLLLKLRPLRFFLVVTVGVLALRAAKGLQTEAADIIDQ